MTEAQKEQRRYALAVSGGVCEVCGKPLNEGQPQGAHRIAQSKYGYKKYGSLVVDHRFNIGYTCSLKCNGKLDITQNPVECAKLCERIYKSELIRLGAL